MYNFVINIIRRGFNVIRRKNFQTSFSCDKIDVIFSCPNELRWRDNIDVQTILLFLFFFCLKVDVKSISTAHQNDMKIVTWAQVNLIFNEGSPVKSLLLKNRSFPR